jgi:hypothetical protein
MKTAVIYSPANPDSCLAAAIANTICRVKHTCATNPEEWKHTVFPYYRANPDNILPSGMNELIVLGADLSPSDMSTILDNNPDAIIIIEVYNNSTVYSGKLQKRLKGSNVYYSNSDITHIEVSHEEAVLNSTFNKIMLDSVSRRMYEKLVNVISPDALIAEQDNRYDNYLKNVNELCGVVSRYCAFDSLSAAETLFVFSNTDMIRDAARDEVKLCIVNSPDAESIADRIIWNASYTRYVRNIREDIQSNNRMAYYAGANGTTFLTPTLNINERDALTAMRFINYAHDEVISYEDKHSNRIYRLYSSNNTNLDWYIKRFEPHDVWSEGSLIYLEVDLPVHIK